MIVTNQGLQVSRFESRCSFIGIGRRAEWGFRQSRTRFPDLPETVRIIPESRSRCPGIPKQRLEYQAGLLRGKTWSPEEDSERRPQVSVEPRYTLYRKSSDQIESGT